MSREHTELEQDSLAQDSLAQGEEVAMPRGNALVARACLAGLVWCLLFWVGSGFAPGSVVTSPVARADTPTPAPTAAPSVADVVEDGTGGTRVLTFAALTAAGVLAFGAGLVVIVAGRRSAQRDESVPSSSSASEVAVGQTDEAAAEEQVVLWVSDGAGLSIFDDAADDEALAGTSAVGIGAVQVDAPAVPEEAPAVPEAVPDEAMIATAVHQRFDFDAYAAEQTAHRASPEAIPTPQRVSEVVPEPALPPVPEAVFLGRRADPASAMSPEFVVGEDVENSEEDDVELFRRAVGSHRRATLDGPGRNEISQPEKEKVNPEDPALLARRAVRMSPESVALQDGLADEGEPQQPRPRRAWIDHD